MAQVDSENTTAMPVDPTRRRFLSAAAGGAIALALPLAPAGAGAPDPIFAAIEHHRAAGIVWAAAVDVCADFPEFDITDEQRRQRNLLEDATDAAWEACDQAGIDLVTTAPTTPAGIIAAIRYVQIQIRDDIYMPRSMPDQLSNGVKYEGDDPAMLA